MAPLGKAEVISQDWSDTANHLVPVDLFLLERWDESSTETVEAQRSRLYEEFVASGRQGRQPYITALKERTFAEPTPAQVEKILRVVRSPFERRFAARLKGPIVLQTCYDGDFEQIDDGYLSMFTRIGFNSNPRNPRPLLFDPKKYDYGDDWQQVLSIFPEIVDNRRPPYNVRIEDIRVWEDVDEQEIYDPDVARQYLSVTGAIIIRDELSDRRPPGEGPTLPEGERWPLDQLRGNLLHVWLDQYGEAVRWLRCSTQDLVDIIGHKGDGRPEQEYRHYFAEALGEVGASF